MAFFKGVAKDTHQTMKSRHSGEESGIRAWELKGTFTFYPIFFYITRYVFVILTGQKQVTKNLLSCVHAVIF